MCNFIQEMYRNDEALYIYLNVYTSIYGINLYNLGELHIHEGGRSIGS